MATITTPPQTESEPISISGGVYGRPPPNAKSPPPKNSTKWFLWKGDLKPTTCADCKAKIGKIYNEDELKKIELPPLHPNCGCKLVSYSGKPSMTTTAPQSKREPATKPGGERGVTNPLIVQLKRLFKLLFPGNPTLQLPPSPITAAFEKTLSERERTFLRNFQFNNIRDAIEAVEFYREVQRDFRAIEKLNDLTKKERDFFLNALMGATFGMTAQEYDEFLINMAMMAGGGMKVKGVKPLKTPVKLPPKKTIQPWRGSETHVQGQNPRYNRQLSFRDGQRVTYGTKGSVRPDLYTKGNSIEIKNYNLESASGQSNLVYNVSRQVNQRVIHLPYGTRQTISVDVSGQVVSQAQLNAIRNRILQRCNVPVDIIFFRR